jgi:3-keto-disaccharide hydrolase
MHICLWCGLTLAFFSVGARLDDPAEIPGFARVLPTIKTGKAILAFNGKDLTGFYPYTRDHRYDDPNKVFTVEDRMIRISGQEFGGLATCGNFSDYHLVVEWKWGTKTWPPREKASRDSGILLHCVGPDGAAGGQWMESIECQIIEGGCGDLLVVPGQGRLSLTCETRVGPDKQLYFEKGGKPVVKTSGRFNWWGRDPAWKDVLGYRGARDLEKAAGEWNRMEVVCDGDTITNIVNGYVVNVGTRSSLTQGKIQFQSEGAEIFFRTIEIRPLLKSKD